MGLGIVIGVVGTLATGYGLYRLATSNYVGRIMDGPSKKRQSVVLAPRMRLVQ